MSKSFKISIFGIIGGVTGLALGVLNAFNYPLYYSVGVGAQIGLFQGAVVGIVIGLTTFKWRTELKEYLKKLRRCKFRKWQFTTVLVFLSPFIIYGPYHWYVFAFNRDSIVTPRIGLEGQNVHLGVWFFITFSLFCILAIIIGSLCLLKTLKVKKSLNQNLT